MRRPEANLDLSFAAGILVGAAVGTILGILYAPKPGHETREDIRRKSRELRDTTATAVNRVKEAGSRVIRRGREETMGPETPGMSS